MSGPRDPAAPREDPRVAAVVLTWNDVEMARTCIQSLTKNDYSALEIVLVDNGSDFPTIAPLEAEVPGLVSVQLPENTGFCGGCNAGLRKALELGVDYAFLLNNDTVVDPSATRELVRAMEERPEVGMASALMLYPGEDKPVQDFRADLHRDRASITRYGAGVPVSDEHRRVVETEFAPACAVMFRAEALRQVGLFDESFFTNWEDFDLCVRLADAGWKLVTVGTAEVVHMEGQTTGLESPFITYFSVRNRLVCLFRHGRPAAVVRNLPAVLRSLFRQVQRYGFGNWACHRAFARGVIHFLLGVRGKGTGTLSRDDRRTGKKK